MVDSLLLRKQILEKKLSNNVAELQKTRGKSVNLWRRKQDRAAIPTDFSLGQAGLARDLQGWAGKMSPVATNDYF